MAEFSSFSKVLQLSCKICLRLKVSKRLFWLWNEKIAFFFFLHLKKIVVELFSSYSNM